MKKILLILSVLFFVSCVETDVKLNKKEEVKIVSYVKEIDGTSFSNPVIIYGTDFGNFFNTLYRQGKFEDMIKFTSKESVDFHGKDKIINFYKNKMKFGYEIGKAKSKTINGDYIILNYDANIIATKRVIRITIVVENDSCKIVLPNKLKNFPR